MCNDMDDVSENMVQHGTRRQNPGGFFVFIAKAPWTEEMGRRAPEWRRPGGCPVGSVGYIDFIWDHMVY